MLFLTSVGDNPLRLASVLAQALLRSQIVIVTGGLGPTEDDLTKEVLAAVTGRQLSVDPDALAHVRKFFQATGREMPENNMRQAMLPEGRRDAAQPQGDCPRRLLDEPWRPRLLPSRRADGNEDDVERVGRSQAYRAHGRSRRDSLPTLRFYGIGESALEERVKDLLPRKILPSPLTPASEKLACGSRHELSPRKQHGR